MEIVKKRRSCPLMVQYFWDAIACITQQRNTPTFERLAAHIKRKHDVQDNELQRQLDYAVQDDLVLYVKRVSYKCATMPESAGSYRMPDGNKDPGHKDWYCFSCHRSGEVVCCSTCHRVYHPFCLKEDLDPSQAFICSVCKMCASPKFQLNVVELNQLLLYTCDRLNEKVKGDLSYPCLSRRPGVPNINTQALEGEPLVQSTKEKTRQTQLEEEYWRQSHLIFYYIDLVIMEENAKNQMYRSLEEFQAHAMNILHNVVIFCGVHSDMADLAKYMLDDCVYDLNEIRRCKDCYRLSNEKPDRYWFCQPCDPPHDLVYAKQTGFPYWPAKVMKVEGDVYDVRFFGGCYQRAGIEKRNIRGIDVDLSSLGIKKSMAWTKAFEELKFHRQLLGQQVSKIEPVTRVKVEKRKKKRGRKPDPKTKRAKMAKVATQPLPPVLAPPPPVEVTESEGETSQNESSISSTTKSVKLSTTAEDFNVVSSSCQESSAVAPRHITQGTQTKYLSFPPRPQFQTTSKQHNKHTQVNLDVTLDTLPRMSVQKMRETLKTCKDKTTKEVTARLERRHAVEREKAVSAAKNSLQLELNKLRQLVDAQSSSGQLCGTTSTKTERKQAEERDKVVVADTKVNFQHELEKVRQKTEAKLLADHRSEIEMLNERHRCFVSEVKKKQWCYHCGSEAIYHCCWNTSYCSTECQQSHWQKEHKRHCRRKR